MRLAAVFVLLALLLAAVPAGAAEPDLGQVWDRFDARIVDWPCLTVPRMRVVDWFPEPDGRWGSYSFGLRLVSVRSDAPSWVATHEFAHHLWSVCRVERRPLGRRFLAAVGSVRWDYQTQEWFAATLTWLLTGRGRQDIRRDVAWTLRPLVADA
jgi:hypothetical protein